MIVATTHTLSNHGYQTWSTAAIGLGVVALAALVTFLWRSRRATRAPSPPPPVRSADHGAFPVPPMPVKERADA